MAMFLYGADPPLPEGLPLWGPLRQDKDND